MKERKTDSKKLLELIDKLPGFCQDLLIGRKSERAINTRLAYAHDLTHFFEFLHDTHPYFCVIDIKELKPADMANVKAIDIDKYIEIYSDNHSDRSTARMKASISAMYRYLHNTLEAVPTNPVLGAQKIKIMQQDFVIYLTMNEQDKLLNTIKYGNGLTKRQLALHKNYKKRDLAMIFLFLDTGLRVSELHGIDNEDIDYKNHSVIIRRKGGKLQQVYFSDECTEYLTDYMQEKENSLQIQCTPKNPMFVTLKGERLSVRQMEEIIPKYIAAALPERGVLNCHKLRSSFAMEFIMRPAEFGGGNMLELQERMGHKSIQSTNVYAKAARNVSRDTRNWRSQTK